jgi:peptidyl-prolyl isomerase G (cyclophilin G)
LFYLPAEVQSSSVLEKELPPMSHKRREVDDMLGEEEFPKENGAQRSNGIGVNYRLDRSEERQPDVMDDNPGKSRSTFKSCHTSVFSYAYHFFQIWYFIKS